jgi:hypothetical protein
MLDPLSRRSFFASLLAAVLAALGWRRPSPAAAPSPAPPAPPASSYYPVVCTVTTRTYDAFNRINRSENPRQPKANHNE